MTVHPSSAPYGYRSGGRYNASCSTMSSTFTDARAYTVASGKYAPSPVSTPSAPNASNVYVMR
jgi:hypothetical protein